jgi:hypothetical protein
LAKSGANASEEDPTDSDENLTENSSIQENEELKEEYTVAFYANQLPTNTDTIANLVKDRNFAYYQLGVIYKEKFKEYSRASDKLEKLLLNQPEERLILPAMYNLYKIYEIVDKSKAVAMKEKISKMYPDSRYAQIINNTDTNTQSSLSPDDTFTSLYREYESGLLREAYSKTNLAIEQYTGEDILPKLEFLKANLLAKLKGLNEYKNHLNYIALNYPNSKEGKEAEAFISNRIPYLESLSFNSETPVSWKIIYQANDLTVKSKLIEKLTLFIKDRSSDNLTLSTDIYTLDENFIVVHGFKSKEGATNASIVLKEIKEYKVEDLAYIISNENYKIVQMKKLFQEYNTENWLSKPIELKEININSTATSDTEKNISVTKEAVKNALNNVKPASKDKTATENASNQKLNSSAEGMDSKDLLDGQDLPTQMVQPVIKK